MQCFVPELAINISTLSNEELIALLRYLIDLRGPESFNQVLHEYQEQPERNSAASLFASGSPQRIIQDTEYFDLLANDAKKAIAGGHTQTGG
ncbi:hypothetical protein GMRT_jh004 [Giardia muris]|uniref:Uncharacterized protein n=1 Tax=Giardia muris TaxID=5742 RepID=A0A4Z1T9E4_GIAMU|nr:hypothetical protein GMRT_jh004 [Giardia muris]|eukprot:TNJ29141.1 hypothetical protein GMRT_jh004 [Giardia muris]